MNTYQLSYTKIWICFHMKFQINDEKVITCTSSTIY
jgi:hypothetical protein